LYFTAVKKLIAVFYLIGAVAMAQNNVVSQKLVCDTFHGVDDFNRIYYSIDQTLYKKSTQETQQFFDVQLGDIHHVDLINPLKILVFYQDSQTIVILDNRLNEQFRLDLSTLNPQRYIQEARLAGERRLWLFNADVSQIELYDYINNRLIVSSIPIKSNIHDLATDYNFCHVITDQWVISFNAYGSKTSKIEFDRIDHFAFDFERLLVHTDSGWSGYYFDREFRFRESEINTSSLPKMNIESLYLKAGKLYICHNDQLEIYPINLKKE